MATTQEAQSAWAAGFIDGEGCFAIVRRHDPRSASGMRYQIRLIVGNTHLPSLEVLKSLWGGSIYSLKVVGNRKPAWQWQLAANALRKALPQFLPFLVTKRDQAYQVQSFLSDDQCIPFVPVSMERMAIRAQLYASIRSFNVRGRVIGSDLDTLTENL